MVYMTGSYARMRFNSPLNGYLYAFRFGVHNFFEWFFVVWLSNIDGQDYPSNVYCILKH